MPKGEVEHVEQGLGNEKKFKQKGKESTTEQRRLSLVFVRCLLLGFALSPFLAGSCSTCCILKNAEP